MLEGMRLRLAKASAQGRLILILSIVALGATHCAPMTWNDEIAFIGALNPWSPLAYSDIPIVANVKQFVNHLRHPGAVYVRPHDESRPPQ
jgi:hypothetical protein